MAKGLTVKVRADASQFTKTMRGVKSSLGALSGPMKIAGITAAAAGASILALGYGISRMMKSASQEASTIESLAMQFETLLGSSGAAKERLEEITKFAATTPFEIKELAATSKLLQTLGGSTLATGAGLRMVGDAAAIAGQPIEEVGLQIGRLYNAITSGTSAGEAVNRLQELGLITGKNKLEFEKLAEAQKKGTIPVLDQERAMKLLSGVLAKTEGAMEKLAQTTEGKLSNMKDNIDQLKVKFGTGFNEGLKGALDATNEFLPKLQDAFKIAGESIGAAITSAVQGDYKRLSAIGQAIGELIVAGFKMATAGMGSELAARISDALSGGIISDITGVDVFKGAADVARSKAAAARFEAKTQVPRDLQSNLSRLIQIATQPTGEVQGTFGGRFRYAGAGEQSMFSDASGRALIKIQEGIERISRNTDPSLFPSR